MSRKLTLTLALATAATIAAVSFGTSSAEARVGGGGGGGSGHAAFSGGRGASHSGRTGGTVVKLNNPGRPGNHTGGFPRRPGGHHWVFHPHGHGHWVFRGGRWIVLDEPIVTEPVASPAVPINPCTCLTKTYTPDGLVVFADICTKESASAPVGGSSPAAAPTPPAGEKSGDASQEPSSQNYAGLTYEQYLAANERSQNN